MLAVVKKPHIEISADTIPEELISFLKDHYKNIDIFEDEDSQDITQTEWYNTMKSKMTPGDTLRRYRKRANLSQSELAEKLGIVKQNISAMENGKRNISKKMAYKIAEFFKVLPGRFI